MKVSVTVEGDKELRRQLAKASKEIARKVEKETYTSGLDIQREAKENLRGYEAWDTGNLANTIMVDKVDGGKSVEIGPEAPYGPYVEQGTRPHFPPPDALEEWARRHGFESAWPICLAINERGLKPRPFLEPAYLAIVNEYLRRLRGILNR